MAPRHLLLIALLPLLAIAGTSFIGQQEQKNAGGAVGSIVNMECKTKGSCEGAAKIRGNSKQTQNIKAGGKGTLANSGKRRKRSPQSINTSNFNTNKVQNIAPGKTGKIENKWRHKRSASFIGSQTQKNAKGAVGSIVNMECKTKGSCKGAAKIRGNSAQTQNIGKGGKGTLSNQGKRRKRSPIKFDKVVVNVEKGGDSTVKDCQGGKCKTAKLGPGTYVKDNSLAEAAAAGQAAGKATLGFVKQGDKIPKIEDVKEEDSTNKTDETDNSD